MGIRVNLRPRVCYNCRVIQKPLWLLSKSEARVLLILLSFLAFTMGERLNFSQRSVKVKVIFSLQVEAPEVNRRIQPSAPHGKHLKENHLGCLERLGESLVLGTGAQGHGPLCPRPRLHWFSGSYSPPNPPWVYYRGIQVIPILCGRDGHGCLHIGPVSLWREWADLGSRDPKPRRREGAER